MKKQQKEIVKKESMRDAWNEFLVKKEKVREQGLKRGMCGHTVLRSRR